MTKHTYYRADDGTIFIPENNEVTTQYCTNNAEASKACIAYEFKTSLSPFAKKIEDCNLSVRARNRLKELNCETVIDICRLAKCDFIMKHGIGKKTLFEVDDFLHSYHLHWKGESKY